MKILITMTTVHTPRNIKDISENIKFFLSEYPDNEVECLIILDNIKDNTVIIRNTEEVSKETPQIKYIQHDEQRLFIKNSIHGINSHLFMREKFNHIIPDNSPQRRNFGPIYAIVYNFDCLITVDDDNFYSDNKWLVNMIYHEKIYPYSKDVTTVGWLDFFNDKIIDEKKKCYAHTKGLITTLNKYDKNESNYSKDEGELVALQGYSLGDPDRTALDRYLCSDLIFNDEDIDLKENVWFNKTWTPLNTQNTIYYKKCFPALFLFTEEIRIGANLYQLRLEDNIMSYILQKISHYFGDFIGYGRPFNIQKRNKHILSHDLKGEWEGILIMEYFLDLLYKTKVSGNTYLEAYESITKQLISATIMAVKPLDTFLFKQIKNMQFWIECMRGITLNKGN